MSNITAGDGGSSFSSASGNTAGEEVQIHFQGASNSLPASTNSNNGSTAPAQEQPPPAKRKRNLPGNPGIENFVFSYWLGICIFSPTLLGLIFRLFYLLFN